METMSLLNLRDIWHVSLTQFSCPKVLGHTFTLAMTSHVVQCMDCSLPL